MNARVLFPLVTAICIGVSIIFLLMSTSGYRRERRAQKNYKKKWEIADKALTLLMMKAVFWKDVEHPLVSDVINIVNEYDEENRKLT